MTEKRKLFITDTNVLIHDPAAIMGFHEHNVFIPWIVLEELDSFKQDPGERGRNSRQALRFIDELTKLKDTETDIEEGIPLSLLSTVVFSESSQTEVPSGILYFQSKDVDTSTGMIKKDTPDNQILAVSLALKDAGQNVIVVSKDRNVRIKAAVLKLPVEDYKNDQTKDINLLYSGMEQLPLDFWEMFEEEPKSWKDHDGYVHYQITTDLAKNWRVNEFLFLEEGGKDKEFMVLEVNGEKAHIRTIRDYRKHPVWGIVARNREQNFALNVLMDPNIDFVSLAGPAGTGKTLLALAASIHQVLEEKRQSEILFTREQAPIGKEMGFLPGTEEAKMAPWFGALFDNIKVLTKKDEKRKGDFLADKAMQKGRFGNPILESIISIKSINFFKGRSFTDEVLIIDETQDTTPKQAKQIITRAGDGTKVIFLGDLAQTSNPYLTGSSSGLAHVVERFGNYSHGAHVTLRAPERSRLAKYAAENL